MHLSGFPARSVQVSDIIRLNSLTVFGHYGVSPAEREVGQKIQLDIELHADLHGACQSDALKDTINYEAVYALVVEAASETKHRLLESMGEDICYQLLKSFPVSKVTIALRKQNLPFPNSLANVEICLTREAPI